MTEVGAIVRIFRGYQPQLLYRVARKSWDAGLVWIDPLDGGRGVWVYPDQTRTASQEELARHQLTQLEGL